MRKTSIIIALITFQFICLSLAAYNSPSSSDSTKQQSIQDQEKKFNLYYNDGMAMLAKENFGIAFDFFQKALKEAKILNNREAIANTQNNIAQIYFNWSQYDKALDHYRSALAIFEELNQKEGMANCLNNIGVVYKNISDYEKAFDYSQKSLTILEDIGTKQQLPMVYDNIGSVYFYWGNFQKALEYYQLSYKIQRELNNKKGVANSLNNIGVVYKQEGDYKSALDNFNKSLKAYESLGDKQELSMILNNIGSVYFYWKEYDKALDFSMRSLKIKQELGNKKGIILSLRNIGNVYSAKGAHGKALEYYLQSQKLAKSIGSKEEMMNNFKAISDNYFKMNDFQNSLKNYKDYVAFKDSIFNEKSRLQIAELQTKFETEQKQKEIQLKDIEISSKEQKIKRQSSIIYIFIAGLALILFSLIIIIRQYQQIKKKDARLQASEEKFRLLFEESDDPFLILSENKIIDCNDATIKLLGFTNKNNLINLHPAQFSPKRQPDNTLSYVSIEKHLNAAYQNGYVRFEWIFQKSNGENFYVDVSLTAITILGKTVLYSVWKDIDKQKKAEAELEKHRNHLEELVQERTFDLEKAKEKAEESDRLKTAFLANMSHEIRTPMNAIIGFSNLLAEPDITQDEKQDFIKLINTNSNNLLNLIDDIIDISKIEAGQIKINMTECNVNQILSELYSSFHEEIKTKGKAGKIELVVKKANDDENFTIVSDPFRFRQIMTNLIGNAIKFTEKDTIAFGYTQPDSTQLQFYVKDSGIGVPNDKLELIFDRFRQVEDSNTRKYGGTGLGLTISRNLVKLLGGKIWVESVLGKGSTFYFTLPFKPIVASTPVQTPITTEHIHFDWNDKTILVAEDLDINYLFIEKALQKTNVNLIRAINGEEAILKCKENNNINLVLMDIRMPVMNGYEATKEIKKFKKELPVIAQTAHALSEEKGKSLEAGCDDYIAKPIKLNVLLPLLNQYLTKTNHK